MNIQNILKVCIEEIYINDKQIMTTQNQSGFHFDKYHESCEENNEMATSKIIIKNRTIITDFCSMIQRPLFNGNRIHCYFQI